MTESDDQAGGRTKRRHRRVPTRGVTAAVRWGDQSHTFVVANLSVGGALVIGGSAPARGARLQIEFKLKGSRTLKVEGQVVHARAEGIGIAFVPLAPDDAEALNAFISAVDSQNLMPPPLPPGRTRSSDELPPQAPRPDDAFFDGNDPRPPRTSAPDDREAYLRVLVKNRDEMLKRGRTAMTAVVAEADALRALAGRLKARLDAALGQQAMHEVALATAREAAARQLEAQLAERTASSEQLEQEQRRTLEAIATVSSLEATVRRHELDVNHAKDEAEQARREAAASALEASSSRRAREELLVANRKAMETQAALNKERSGRLAAEKAAAEAHAAEQAAQEEVQRVKAELARLKGKLVAAEDALERAASRKPAARAQRGAAK